MPAVAAAVALALAMPVSLKTALLAARVLFRLVSVARLDWKVLRAEPSVLRPFSAAVACVLWRVRMLWRPDVKDWARAWAVVAGS